jgi:hypothetical protein
MTKMIVWVLASLTGFVLLASRPALAEEDEDGWGKGPKRMELHNARDQRVQVSCGGANIVSHQLHPSRRFVILGCYDGEKGEQFMRLVNLDRGRSLRVAFGSFSPNGTYGAFKRRGLSAWDPLQLVSLRDFERYMVSGGRAGMVYLGAQRWRPGDCARAVEFDRWMAGDILRYSLAACGTDSLYDYCAATRKKLPVASNLDGSDLARGRRRHSTPIPSPCAATD